jgi:hypothetical protein
VARHWHGIPNQLLLLFDEYPDRTMRPYFCDAKIMLFSESFIPISYFNFVFNVIFHLLRKAETTQHPVDAPF